MGKLWAVIRREYVERVQTRWFVISTIFAPVMFAALLFLPAWLAMRNTASATAADIVILDATGLGLGERVRTNLRAGDVVAAGVSTTRVQVVTADRLVAAESAAAREVSAKRTQGYLVLDPDAVRGDSARYSGRNSTSVSDMRRVETAVRQAALAVRLEREGLDPARIESLTRPRLQLATERLSERGRGGSSTANIAFAIAVAFLLYTSILLYGQNVLRSVIEEKQTRVAEVVVSSVRPEVLLAGKVLGVGAVGLTQQLIWVTMTAYIGSWVAPFLMRMQRPGAGGAPGAPGPSLATALPNVTAGSIALILVFFVLGYLFYSSLYAALGSTVNSEQEAQQAVGPIMILVIGSAVLIQPVMMNPTSGLSRMASLVPFSAPIIMPLRMGLVNVPAADIAIAVAGLAVACVVAVWVAARIYRVGLLMYGKRPTLGELIRWVRYAR